MIKYVSFFGEHSPLFDELNQKACTYAAEKGIEYVWVPQKPYCVEEVIDQLNDADVGMIDVEPYDENIFGRLNDRCKLLIRFGVGFDKVNLTDATAHGLAVARTNGSNKTGVAELALTMILSARRQIMLNRKTVKSGVWVKNIGNELLGKRVGILGFGNIGIALAKLLRGFDCEVLAYDVFHDEKTAAELGVRFADMDEIVETCDAISVHLPYNQETDHIINADVFRRMKKDAVIVCTARGNIVDEEDLYQALKSGQIGGAGLDVYATEPLPVTSRLMELDNIILTPHIASQTYESLWETYKMGIDIAADFFGDVPLGRGVLLNPEYKNNPRQS